MQLHDACSTIILLREVSDLEEDSPLAVVTLSKETGLGHAGLGQVHIHPAPLQRLLQFHCRQLVVQLGIGVRCEVTMMTVKAPAAKL